METTYNHLEAEKAAQEFWQKHDVYKAERNPGPLFSIDTPPPTVSGALHIGHVFSYTQADIIARYKRMAGFSVFYPFGFDDNGLATERFVEKKCGVSALQLGRSAFIQLCLEQTREAEKQFEQLWKRMGLSIEWSACYSTISDQSRRISQKSFIELYNKGFLYRKEEPAPYCTVCRTSVAQAELEDVERKSTFVEVLFKAADGSDLIIATTRPELISSCVALFYNPDDHRYTHLKGTSAHVPLFDYAVPILEDRRVIADKGTGLVMCSTFGDKMDVEWFKGFNLPYTPSLGRDGRMLEKAHFLAGMKVAEARQAIILKLKEEGLVRSEKPIEHTVNIHERCKHEIEYLALPQWFLRLLPYKKEFLAAANQITWYPDFMKYRYINWVENISWDWCLSRQRFYGIPFPVWYCVSCSAVILADKEQLPVDPLQSWPPTKCSECGGNDFIPDSDVMDTWNTSSLTPYICRELYTGKREDFLPMTMRPQAHDIIRTWAFYTIVKTWMHDNCIPWDSIVISGHVLTTQGQKISKSQENSPLVPENLLKAYPADVIRYWTASALLGTDVAFSDTQLRIGQKLLVKLWNAFRFIREHGDCSTAHEWVHAPITGITTAWIMQRITQTLHSYKKYFDACEFNLALEVADRFFWNDFCSNYLELIKDQFFNPDKYAGPEVLESKKALAYVGVRILQLYAPFMPHITETIYRLLFSSSYHVDSIHQLRFNALQEPLPVIEAIAPMEAILDSVTQIRKLKSDHALSLKTPLAVLYIAASPSYSSPSVVIHEFLKPHEQLIKGITGAQEIVYLEKLEAGVSTLEKQDGSWYGYIIIS